MTKKLALMRLVMVMAIIAAMSFSTAKATALTEVLRSEDTVEINGDVDMFEEDINGETAEVNYGQEKYVIFYKTIPTGIEKERILEIDVMAATPVSGDNMEILSEKAYTISDEGKITFPIGYTADMIPKEFYHGPFKVFIKLKK